MRKSLDSLICLNRKWGVRARPGILSATKGDRETRVPCEMLVDDVAGSADRLFEARAAPHLRQEVQGPLETLAVFPRRGLSGLPWLARLLGAAAGASDRYFTTAAVRRSLSQA